MLEAQFLRSDLRTHRKQPCLGRLGRSEKLRDLLLAERPASLHLFCACGVGPRIRERRLGLGQPGARLREVGLDGLGREYSQHLPAHHRIADVGAHFGHAQPARLGADDRLLPGGEAARGLYVEGHVDALRRDGGHGQRGFAGRLGAALVLCAAGASKPEQAAGGRNSGDGTKSHGEFRLEGSGSQPPPAAR